MQNSADTKIKVFSFIFIEINILRYFVKLLEFDNVCKAGTKESHFFLVYWTDLKPFTYYQRIKKLDLYTYTIFCTYIRYRIIVSQQL